MFIDGSPAAGARGSASRNRSSVNCCRNRARPRAPIAAAAGRSRSMRTTACEQLRRGRRFDQQAGVAVGDDLAGRAAAADAAPCRRASPRQTRGRNPSSRLGMTNAVQRCVLALQRARRRAGRGTSPGRRGPATPPSARAARDRRRRRRSAARAPGTAAGDVAPDVEQRVVSLVALVGAPFGRRSAPTAASGRAPSHVRQRLDAEVADVDRAAGEMRVGRRETGRA